MANPPIILGLNFGGHDTSACLTVGGEIIAACEEERYNKEKHTRAFPEYAIQDCLTQGGITIQDVDEIALGYNPLVLIRETYLKSAIEDERRIEFLIKDIERIKAGFNMKQNIRTRTGFKNEVNYYLHHLCHLASSYYMAGFDRALLVSHDGMGEVNCSLFGAGNNGEIEILHQGTPYPHSLGLLYSAVTHYLGWRHHCDEGIVMGLAPYGDDTQIAPGTHKTYKQIFEEIISETEDFDFRIDLSWIAYHYVRDTWISEKFINTFGPKREAGEPIEERHKHVAAALQNRVETIVLHQLKKARDVYGYNKLCFAGGVALNCALNGKIAQSGLFDEIFVQPASGDAGIAIGACFSAHKRRTGSLAVKKNHNFYLGSHFTNEQIESELKKHPAHYIKPDNIYEMTTQALQNKKIIGWFQGNAEFGPRALGNRSILTAPYPADMKDFINARVKFREPFRPFAPAVLAERASEFFEINQESPHMLIAAQVKPENRKKIPTVIHVDNSARVQTVSEKNNPQFRKLLETFYAHTGIPVLLNTSFNVKGQPIVNSPEDAIKCFLSTNIDILVIGDFFVTKYDQSNNI